MIYLVGGSFRVCPPGHPTVFYLLLFLSLFLSEKEGGVMVKVKVYFT